MVTFRERNNFRRNEEAMVKGHIVVIIKKKGHIVRGLRIWTVHMNGHQISTVGFKK